MLKKHCVLEREDASRLQHVLLSARTLNSDCQKYHLLIIIQEYSAASPLRLEISFR